MTDDRSSTQATSEQALAVAERELRAARVPPEPQSASLASCVGSRASP